MHKKKVFQYNSIFTIHLNNSATRVEQYWNTLDLLLIYTNLLYTIIVEVISVYIYLYFYVYIVLMVAWKNILYCFELIIQTNYILDNIKCKKNNINICTNK